MLSNVLQVLCIYTHPDPPDQHPVRAPGTFMTFMIYKVSTDNKNDTFKTYIENYRNASKSSVNCGIEIKPLAGQGWL